MTWNYRVVRDLYKVGDEERPLYTIREVYYDDEGNIMSWTEGPCHPSGDTWLELGDDHAMMGRAFDLPVVDVSNGRPVELSSP